MSPLISPSSERYFILKHFCICNIQTIINKVDFNGCIPSIPSQITKTIYDLNLESKVAGCGIIYSMNCQGLVA